MSNFVETGIAMQYESASISQAIRRFDHSCEICTRRGRNARCKNCYIRGAHETMVKILKMDATKA